MKKYITTIRVISELTIEVENDCESQEAADEAALKLATAGEYADIIDSEYEFDNYTVTYAVKK